MKKDIRWSTPHKSWLAYSGDKFLLSTDEIEEMKNMLDDLEIMVTCTSCGVTANMDEVEDQMDAQEWLIWSDTGGYCNNVVGDGVTYKIALCQDCINAKLSDCIEIVE